jgi:hypothetical protein
MYFFSLNLSIQLLILNVYVSYDLTNQDIETNVYQSSIKLRYLGTVLNPSTLIDAHGVFIVNIHLINDFCI